MEFPITELLDHDRSVAWIIEYFHPDGLKCPGCQAPVAQARVFRTTDRSQLTTYRCQVCHSPYNLYSGTVFQQHHLRPQQVVLLMWGICKGETTRMLAQELELNYKTVLDLRHIIQAQAEQHQPDRPLPDTHTETDEMFHAKRAGEKR